MQPGGELDSGAWSAALPALAGTMPGSHVPSSTDPAPPVMMFSRFSSQDMLQGYLLGHKHREPQTPNPTLSNNPEAPPTPLSKLAGAVSANPHTCKPWGTLTPQP